MLYFLLEIVLSRTDCFTMLLSNSSVIKENDIKDHKKNTNRSEIEWQKEAKLLNFLLHDYNPNIIPSEKKNESLKLYIGLAMSQLINIVILYKLNTYCLFLILVNIFIKFQVRQRAGDEE